MFNGSHSSKEFVWKPFLCKLSFYGGPLLAGFCPDFNNGFVVAFVYYYVNL